MMSPSDQLQEALARMEAGEPLDPILTGLSSEDAELLKVASAMRAASTLTRAPDKVAAQRQALLQAAQEKSIMTPPATPRAPWAWLAAFSGALAVLAFCAIATVGAGALWWWTSSRSPVAQAPNATATAVAAANPVVAVRQDLHVDPPDPATAALQEAKGAVEVQSADGTWRAASSGALVKAGQRVRTGALSSVTLAFYDGSRARLGPNTEVAVDALDAQRGGARTVRLSQVAGDSDHDVAKSSDPNSVYEVATPSGSGRAKGTEFHVSVIALIVHFDVSEGAVEVTNVNVTVVVVAGQSTIIIGSDQPPAPPVFRITGEGEVQQTGAVWVIAGQALTVNAETVIVGDPQVGDRASFEGRLLADGSHVADRITLVQRALTNPFTFVGTVDAMAADAWTISGRMVRVDAQTAIEAGLQVGDQVEVTGGIAADGTFWASEIRRLAAGETGSPFEFTGVVETMGADAWVVSGISVTVDVSTTLEANIVVGDMVHVTGQILPDGTWLAASIQKAATGTFDFVGVVLSTDPWNVSGVPLATDDATDIDDGIQIGNRVRAQGRVLADGTWLAGRIEQLDEGRRHAVQFTARVESIDPWVVGGVTVTVDNKTKIDANIQVGDLVHVKGNLLPDGTVVANKISLVRENAGCVSTSAVVAAINGSTLTLLDGQTITLDSSIQVTGTLQVASVIIFNGCVDEDGQLTIIAIVVVFQLDVLPPTPPPATGCVTLVVIANGQLSLPAGQFVQMGGVALRVNVSRKGDKVDIKLAGSKDKLEIKIKDKGKQAGEIEIKVHGALAVQGAGKYPAGSTIAVSVCGGPTGLIFTVTSAAATVVAPPSSGPVTICHIPPGNPSKRKTLTVDAADVQGHLNHGDTLGPCAGGGDGDDDKGKDKDDD